MDRFAAAAHDAALSDFCKGIVMGMVNSVASSAEPAPRRPIGRPRGSFDVEGFARLIVTQLVEKALSHSLAQNTKKPRKVYKKWDTTSQEMALAIADEKGSDAVAVSMLRELFPKVFGAILESHIRSFRQEARNRASGIGSSQTPRITTAALSDVVQAIQAHVDAHLEFTTSKLRRVVLALLEERHPMVLTTGFQASIGWLNKLMAQHMRLPMRCISTRRVAGPMTGIGFWVFFVRFRPFCLFLFFFCCLHVPFCFADELEAKHRLVLLRLAWLVWHHGIPPALVASRDQSGILLFPRRGKRRAKKGARQVPGISANDKRALTIDFALTADGQVVPPQVIFEGTTDRCHPANACDFEKDGWQIRHSCNHWSNTDLALEYLEKSSSTSISKKFG